jgi:hypothetical protein
MADPTGLPQGGGGNIPRPNLSCNSLECQAALAAVAPWRDILLVEKSNGITR